jgi:hypothetical protein
MHTQAKYLTRQPVFDRVESLSAIVRALLAERDLEILRLVFEQRALRRDQLGQFMGMSRDATRRAVERLSSLQLVNHARLEPSCPTWVWSTRKGMAVAIPRLLTAAWSEAPPPAYALRHLATTSEVRLRYAHDRPDVTWISERMLLVQRERPGLHRPDTVIEGDGERHAIEVELSRKDGPRVTANVRDLMKNYDAVHYFVSSSTRRLLQQVQAANEWPNLIVHDLPEMP